jgi:radical SAM-linked protein
MTQRELAEAWEAAVLASGLPVAMSEAAVPRARVAFGAPVPTGVAAEAELIDLFLTERVPTWLVRDRLADRLPAGWTLVDLYDVWLAGPALPGQVAAADYRIELATVEPDGAQPGPSAIARAAAELLAARSLPRERARGGGTVPYDLRPLLVDVTVADPGPPVTVRARTRFHPELGTGRPEEVVAALGDALGTRLEPGAIVREGLILADTLARAADPGRS